MLSAAKGEAAPGEYRARYEIRKKIADGGMAEIFVARQAGAEGFSRTVILKRILPGLSADPQFRDMLVDEAHIAMSLNHGNIVPVLDLGEEGGRYFLVMELVDGWDLSAIIARTEKAKVEIPLGLALHMMTEVCRGLAYAHGHQGSQGRPLGIIHRDVSPHNVLLGEQGDVKLTDFGIAKALGKRDRTRTGVIKGKLDFMSPEQASGDPLDASSDLFAVGTILYLLVTGKRPFEGGSDLEVLLKVRRGEYLSLARARPDLPPKVAAIVNKAMQRRPADRYRSAEAMMTDLEEVMRSDFRSPGKSELKRWLAELARKDGAPPTSRRPALPVDEPLGAGSPGEQTATVSGFAETEMQDTGAKTLPRRVKGRPWSTLHILRLGVTLAALSVAGYVAFKLVTPRVRASALDKARGLARKADLESLGQATRAALDALTPPVAEPPAPAMPPPQARSVREARVLLVTRPAGARVLRGNRSLGRTPLRYTIGPGRGEVLRFSKPGYVTASRRITPGPQRKSIVVPLRRVRKR